MEPSPAQHEGPAKDAASEPERESTLLRFKRLTTRLFGVNRDEFLEALKKEEAERRAKRGRSRSIADAGSGNDENRAGKS